MEKDMGASSGSRASTEPASSLGPSGFDPARGSYLLQGPLGEAAMREWDALDLGEPEFAWAAVAERFRGEARMNQRCAESRRKDAADAQEQADLHQARADAFAMLANALERAPVTFPCDSGSRPEGRDGTARVADRQSGVSDSERIAQPPQES